MRQIQDLIFLLFLFGIFIASMSFSCSNDKPTKHTSNDTIDGKPVKQASNDRSVVVSIPMVEDLKTGKNLPPSGNKFALIIGNGDYGSSPLNNPVNDARAVTRVLKALGFEVIKKENANEDQMKQAIDNFGRILERGGGVAVFYYSGHGVQIDGRNYLIPIGSKIRHEKQVEYRAIEVGEVLAELENAMNRLNIVILDACRDNPFSRSFRNAGRGLALMDAPDGTIIAYSTAPGKTASDGYEDNSPYTGELVKWMVEPGLRIEDVFIKTRVGVKNKTNGEQTPWELYSLEGVFYLNPGDSSDMLVSRTGQTDDRETTTDPTGEKVHSTDTQSETSASARLSAEVNFQNGKEHLEQKEYDLALESFTNAIELDPFFAEAYKERGNSYYYKRQYANALADFSRAIETDPKYAPAYNNRGIAYSVLGNYEQAIEDYSKAIELNAGFHTAYNNLGRTLYTQGKSQRAIDEYTKAIAIDPKYGIAYNNRGNSYFSQEKYQHAIDDYTKAIEVSPDFAEAYNNRGLTYYYQGMNHRAIDDYTRAIEADPRYIKAYENRGFVYEELGEHQKAMKDREIAMKLSTKE